jgi:SAM-dependent methyltransferase
MSHENDPAEFDRYARDYGRLHAQSIGASGEEPAYFAHYKIAEVARCIGSDKDSSSFQILDFGCGIGGSLPYLADFFSHAQITGVDVSAASIKIARSTCPEQVALVHYDGNRLPFGDDRFDLVFTSCVFHHIPPVVRLAALRDIRRTLKPGGSFYFFEHNPWNPLTARVVKDCPFDEDAILLTSTEARNLLQEAGFASLRLAYTVFFPHALAFLRPTERYLHALPFGAQYYFQAIA